MKTKLRLILPFLIMVFTSGTFGQDTGAGAPIVKTEPTPVHEIIDAKYRQRNNRLSRSY
jgi:hypothetical protein